MTTVEGPTEAARDANHSRRPYVLMIAPGPFFVDRGFGVAIYEQARALSARGVRVEVVCYPSGRNVAAVVTHRPIPLPGYSASTIGPSPTRLPLWFFLLIKTLQVARRERPDLLHGHLHEGALIAAIVSRLTGVPWVFDFQGSLSLEMAEKSALRPRSLPFRGVTALERWIDKLAPQILVKSVVMQRDLEDRFRIEQSRIVRVMDGADPGVFSPREGDPLLRQRLGIQPDATVIGYLGLLTEQQGIDRLLRGVALLPPRHRDWHMLIMGYPSYGPKRLAQELSLSPRVTFTGKVDYLNAPAYLALADLAVAPKVSRTEGNGKLYNYMGMALPVVSIDNPGNREILGEHAYYVEGEEPEDFARGIREALETRDTWGERGLRLRSRLQKRFTWDAVASRLLAAYEQVSPLPFRQLRN